jgi:hypothetical protein
MDTNDDLIDVHTYEGYMCMILSRGCFYTPLKFSPCPIECLNLRSGY